MENDFFSLKDYEHRALFEHCQHPWDALKNLKNYLLNFQYSTFLCDQFPGVFFHDLEKIFLGKNVQIEPGVYIKGPCVIGDGSHIRHGAYLRGHVITGKQCVIGHCSEVKETILLDHVSVPHFNYVGNSILGNRVNLGAGVKCANFRLDGQSIRVKCDGVKMETGLKKLGAIIGDDSSLGCNCVTSPGTLIQKSGRYLPLTHIR